MIKLRASRSMHEIKGGGNHFHTQREEFYCTLTSFGREIRGNERMSIHEQTILFTFYNLVRFGNVKSMSEPLFMTWIIPSDIFNLI